MKLHLLLADDLGETKNAAAAEPRRVVQSERLLAASRTENPDCPLAGKPMKQT